MHFTPAARRAGLRPAALLAALLALAACVSPADSRSDPQARFMTALASHCGKAYAGRLVSTDAADADMAGRAMVVHFRECSPDRMAIPFHVQAEDGTWDRSRTWLITRTAAGLRLKHDHRHADGSKDAVTMYGGDTADNGSAGAQDFPVDAESIALFRAIRFQLFLGFGAEARALARPAAEDFGGSIRRCGQGGGQGRDHARHNRGGTRYGRPAAA